MATSDPLKLRARDLEDMAVIASVLQDALVPLRDVTFLKREKRFVMVVNRFRWEEKKSERAAARAAPSGGDARFEDEPDAPVFERVNCGVCFDRVRGVQVRGLDLGDRTHILNLLTIQAEPRWITLVFSDDAAIRLEVAGIVCHVEDLGEPWPTRWHPSHEDSAPSSAGS
jgi:hypothetical protein